MKTKLNNSDWQESWEKQYIDFKTPEDAQQCLKWFSFELQRAFSDGEENQAREDQKDILRLINEAIKQERDKTLKEVEGIIGEDEKLIPFTGKNKWAIYSEKVGRNQLRHELLSKLNNLREK